MKRLSWFMFGAIAGPAAVVGILLLIVERSTRPPMAPEGDVVSIVPAVAGGAGVSRSAILGASLGGQLA